MSIFTTVIDWFSSFLVQCPGTAVNTALSLVPQHKVRLALLLLLLAVYQYPCLCFSMFNPRPLFVMCTILALLTQYEIFTVCCVYIHSLYRSAVNFCFLSPHPALQVIQAAKCPHALPSFRLLLLSSPILTSRDKYT